MDRIADFNKVDPTSSSALTRYVQNLARRPMDSLDLGGVQDAVTNLLKLGDIEEAEAIYQAVANYSLASNSGRSKPEFQLSLLKQINLTKQMKPITDALRQVTLAGQKPEAIVKPEGFEQRRNLSTFSDLSEADATKFRLYLIKTHQEPTYLGFWFEFMHDLPHDEAGYNLKLNLLKAGLENASEDGSKAALVLLAGEFWMGDKPALCQKFNELTQSYRDPGKYPQTAESIRMFDALIALRTGKALNLETDLAGFNGSLQCQGGRSPEN